MIKGNASEPFMKKPTSSSPSRRAFLKGTSAIAAAPAFLTGASIDNAINVGLVGCGGRGAGAAAQALTADDKAVLTAVADVSQEQIDQSLALVAEKHGDKVQVEPSHQFLGLDAYEGVIDSDVDVVLLATPPGFRPSHVRKVIDAGKHMFCEKPVAVDAPGVRSVLESSRMADEKGLAICSGFCWRYSNYIVETFDQIHGGAIGDLVAYYATYYTSPVKPIPPAGNRQAGQTDIEWQVANWYNFCWLSGDSLVEQAIHSVDKVAWAMHDQPPESCVAVGGRSVPAHGGNIYDHFEVNYLYPNGVRAFVANRQMVGCHNENSDYILGTKGRCTIGKGPIPRIEGETSWAFRGDKYNMYQREHDVLFSAVRRGEPFNDGHRMATSTMLGIMGRMAAYSGKQITWDEALNSQVQLFPDQLDWNMPSFARPMPVPGRTEVL